jgi:hypothetical protein
MRLLTTTVLLLFLSHLVRAPEPDLFPKPDDEPPSKTAPDDTPTGTEEATLTGDTVTPTPTPTEPEKEDHLNDFLENAPCALGCYNQACLKTSISTDCFCQNNSTIENCVSNSCRSNELGELVQVLAYVCGMRGMSSDLMMREWDGK